MRSRALWTTCSCRNCCVSGQPDRQAQSRRSHGPGATALARHRPGASTARTVLGTMRSRPSGGALAVTRPARGGSCPARADLPALHREFFGAYPRTGQRLAACDRGPRLKNRRFCRNSHEFQNGLAGFNPAAASSRGKRTVSITRPAIRNEAASAKAVVTN
jgi:hypothetical protein